MQTKMRRLPRQFLAAHEDEPRQVSRELHNEVIQTLAGISVALAALGGADSHNPRPCQQRIPRPQRQVEKSIGAVHPFARELRAAVLDHLGLIAARQIFLEGLSARKKHVISLTAFAGVEALDHSQRTVLYRVAQEALTNGGRHARARTGDVTISEIPGAVRLEVKDDGKSFRVQRIFSSLATDRVGLLGMRERVEMRGRVLTIEPTRPQGPAVRVEIPVGPRGAS
jgi:signal transduction histidine kinase